MSESDLSEWETRRDAKAKKLGMEIHYPEPDELFIDIDDAASLKVFHDGLGLLGARVLGYTRTPSNGGGDHWHIRVKLGDAPPDFERIVLQALLGSDRKRELLSFMTIGESKQVTCFFEKPPAVAIPEASALDSEPVF